MTLHLPTLNFLSIAVLALSAGVMTLFGRTGRVYRGFWWWATAQWLLALGLLLHALRDEEPSLLPLANLLILQWPIVVLTGMRRFYARHTWRVPALVDWLLLTLAFGAWLAASAAQGSVATCVTAFAVGAFALNLYGAVLLMRLADFRHSSALKALALTEWAAAVVQAFRILQVQAPSPGRLAGDAVPVASALVVVVSALVMVYFGLLLTCERTESNLRVTRRKLRFLANMDTLTRVPNRRHFHELAGRALQSIEAARAAVMMFDIDHFKQINDLLGHAVGDEALRQVGRCTRDTLREVDVAGRLGGDEFAVLLPGTSVSDAMAVAARIVGKLEHRQVAPRIAPLSLSFGVVQMFPDETMAEALHRADQALYEAKRQGRSCAVAATGDEEQPVFGESRRLGLAAG
ncbi:GGDEF domain-containing protein [Piscinibacter sp.]|jgi:diguanylate cyclase (GGDEF)-like protein|uniref:GGDEF domain-containing protein n=1 Tax=Piscinibacter sp. TaxID=1903157 RepID=UPI002F420513